MKVYLLTSTIVVLFLYIFQIQIGFAQTNDTQNKNCGINPHAWPCCIEPTDDIFCEKSPIFYSSYINGSSEVPPVETEFQGGANFVYQNNITESNTDILAFEIYLNQKSTTETIQIHQGKDGENGPVVATLYKSEDIPCCLFGSISSKQLEGPLEDKSLSLLKELMNNNNAYINVKTKLYPEGEIRGQIFNTNGTIIEFKGFGR